MVIAGELRLRSGQVTWAWGMATAGFAGSGLSLLSSKKQAKEGFLQAWRIEAGLEDEAVPGASRLVQDWHCTLVPGLYSGCWGIAENKALVGRDR